MSGSSWHCSRGSFSSSGANGVGKTNLLEAVHVATQGFSPRTRTDSQVVRFGAEGARAAVAGRRGEVGLELEVTVRRGEGKRARLNGAPLRAAEQLRGLVSTLVFTPDRLGVVKGPPAARRAYFDRVLGRFAPARASLPTEYGAAVAQRNAALRRVAVGASSRDAVEPWSERVASLGAELVACAARDSRAARAALRRSRGRVRARRRVAPVRRRAADAGRAGRRCSSAISSAA